MIFLGVVDHAALRGAVLLAQAVTQTYSFDLSHYPQWLVVLAGTLVAALIIWLLIKLLKWTLWIMLICVLIGGVLWSMTLLIG